MQQLLTPPRLRTFLGASAIGLCLLPPVAASATPAQPASATVTAARGAYATPTLKITGGTNLKKAQGAERYMATSPVKANFTMPAGATELVLWGGPSKENKFLPVNEQIIKGTGTITVNMPTAVWQLYWVARGPKGQSQSGGVRLAIAPASPVVHVPAVTPKGSVVTLASLQSEFGTAPDGAVFTTFAQIPDDNLFPIGHWLVEVGTAGKGSSDAYRMARVVFVDPNMKVKKTPVKAVTSNNPTYTPNVPKALAYTGTDLRPQLYSSAALAAIGAGAISAALVRRRARG